MYTGPSAQIVVGFDNTPGAVQAALWAAHEASARHLGLTVLMAHEAARHPHDEHDEAYRDHERRGLDDIVERLRRTYPTLHVRAEVSTGSAVAMLADASRHATLVVVGSRQLGGFGSTFLGSVSCAVAVGSCCPVVVIREPTKSPRTHGVVVGVNAAQETHAVLAFAFEYASSHALPLQVLMCVDELAAKPHGQYAHTIQRELEPVLSETMAPWREKFPDVDAVGLVTVEHPVAGLVRASAGTDLLVVGSHGHRPQIGGMLGSVSQGVLHHAQCPVAVVSVRD